MGKYIKAKQVFRQLIPQQEKALGAEHKDTLVSKHMLGCTLYNQGKYAEAK